MKVAVRPRAWPWNDCFLSREDQDASSIPSITHDKLAQALCSYYSRLNAKASPFASQVPLQITTVPHLVEVIPKMCHRPFLVPTTGAASLKQSDGPEAPWSHAVDSMLSGLQLPCAFPDASQPHNACLQDGLRMNSCQFQHI